MLETGSTAVRHRFGCKDLRFSNSFVFRRPRRRYYALSTCRSVSEISQPEFSWEPYHSVAAAAAAASVSVFSYRC